MDQNQVQSSSSKLKSIISIDDKLFHYMMSVTSREPEVLQRLREETAKHPRAGMQISVDQGQFFSLLIKLMQAKKTLEIGVFTGYSSLSVALALPEDGKLIACDVSEEFTNIAKKYWKDANVEHKIDLRLAPAVQTLDELISNGQSETFDFAFIDADKSNYYNYYERCLKLVRKGGLIAIDNVLWAGKVADDTAQDEDTNAIRLLNQKLHVDPRIELSMVAIGDGVTFAFKK